MEVNTIFAKNDICAFPFREDDAARRGFTSKFTVKKLVNFLERNEIGMARKGENIYKRKDGRWEGRYISGRREDGRAQYTSIYGHSYTEVKDALNKRRAENADKKISVCRLTVKVLCLQWLDQVRSTVKESSYFRYEQLVKKHIIPTLGGRRADTLTGNFLSRFVNDKLAHGRLDGKGGLSAKTVQDITIVVKSVLKLAEQEYGLTNRSSTVKLPKAGQTEARVLCGADALRLEQHLRSVLDNSNAGILLCLYTGIRLGEVCALRWSDIDWDKHILRIRKTVLRLPRQSDDSERKTRLTLTKPKTKCAEREIPLPSALWECLSRIAKGQNEDAYVLTGQVGRFMDPRTYQYRFQSLLKRLGIERVCFHSLRHTFATQSIQCGIDVKSLSEILGHSTVEMTLKRYVHSSMEIKCRQMEQLKFVA